MDINAQIISSIKRTNKSENSIEKEIGLAPSSIRGWRNNRCKPSIDAIIKIADYFGITIDELIGREPIKQPLQAPLDPETRELLDGWNQLTKTQKQRILGQIQGLQGLNTTKTEEEMFSENELIGREKANAKNKNRVTNMA